MLTLEDVLKVARLIDQCGEPTPGFLVDGTANLEAHCSLGDHSVLAESPALGTPASTTGTVRLRLEYEADDITGDVRIARK